MPYKPGTTVTGEKPGFISVITDNQYVLSIFPVGASASSIAKIIQYLKDHTDNETFKKVVTAGNGIEVYGNKSVLQPLADTITKTFSDVSSEMRLNMYVVIALLIVIAAFYFLILKKYI